MLFTHLVNGNNIGMIEPRRRLRFGAESFHFAFTGELAGEDEFERHDAIQRDITSAKHHAHAAVAYLFKEFVVTEAPDLRDGKPVEVRLVFVPSAGVKRRVRQARLQQAPRTDASRSETPQG